MALPGRTCLQKRIHNFKSGFGFNPRIFEALFEKTKDMDAFSRHGGLVFDEMKISEHLDVKPTGALEGFVDLAQFTPDAQREQLSDHGMVVIFQPYQGNWTQILGVFASRGNVKANVLAKIIVEATILCEKAGLFVDSVTCDGATWNRSMWKLFGIKGTIKGIQSKAPHPVVQTRHLHFFSDFPHLLKNLRNAFVTTGFHTPQGYTNVGFIREAWKSDCKSVSLKVMPKITNAHLSPDAFQKMRMGLAFQLFGDEVIKGLFLYSKKIEKACGPVAPTQCFVEKINRLIRVMTSRTPNKALYLRSSNCQFLEEFLSYLTEWEQYAKVRNGGFLSENTAEGLRVTIKSTLELLEFLTSVGFRYLLTANLSQDKLENVFGIVRQMSGTNDHPTAAQFLLTINALAFYNLARPPKSGNCSPQVITSLISGTKLQPPTQRTIDAVDCLIDEGNFSGAEAALVSCISTDHTPCVVQKSHDMLTYYIAGYVARKALRMTQCEHCGSSLTTDKSEAMRSDQASQFTAKFDNGGLLYPSGPLSAAIGVLEDSFTTYFSVNKLHEKSLVDFSAFLRNTELPLLGCKVHAAALTKNVVKFYVLLRFRFLTKSQNNERAEKQQRMKLLKLRRCN